MPLEPMGLRHGSASTVLCTRFKESEWHARLGGSVYADAIMGRIVHNVVWLCMGEKNMRKEMAAREDETTQPAPARDIVGPASQ